MHRRTKRIVPKLHPAPYSGICDRPCDQDLSAIFSVVDHLVGRAGRTNLALALRGSRAKRVVELGLEKVRGHGHYAGRSQEEVLAIIDQLIVIRLLRVGYHDGFPLLEYAPAGLELAMRFVAESWLAELRTQVAVAAAGEQPSLPFLEGDVSQRNHGTVELLVAMVAREADLGWLPLLRIWHAAETRRLKAALLPLIERLAR